LIKSPIGVFDSGYGGLTVLREIVNKLPQYDYIYLGDNARAPYGTRSFEMVYRYTLECVEWLLNQNCPLIILACNTASSKALKTIQQYDLKRLSTTARVLGVLRPTTEIIGNYTTSNSIGILATKGTVLSLSYVNEINEFFPKVKIEQEACPMWVPLVENNEYKSDGADYFVKKNLMNLLKKDINIDTLLLACTHYPLLQEKIKKHLPENIKVISQGNIVADSLIEYLGRHYEIENEISKEGKCEFFTTDSTEDFNQKASMFFGKIIKSRHVDL
jgi:glutamate racemase